MALLCSKSRRCAPPQMEWSQIPYPVPAQPKLSALSPSTLPSAASFPAVLPRHLSTSLLSLTPALRLCLSAPLPGRSSPGSGFLNFSTINIWGQTILCRRGCSVHCGMYNRVPGLYLLNTNSTSQMLPSSPEGHNCPRLRTIGLDRLHGPRPHFPQISPSQGDLVWPTHSLLPHPPPPRFQSPLSCWLFKTTIMLASHRAGIFLCFASWGIPSALNRAWHTTGSQQIFVE